jgi:hypothetical protein
MQPRINRALLTSRHDLDTDDVADFRVSIKPTCWSWQRLTTTMKVFLGAIAASRSWWAARHHELMLVSVTERTR